MPRPSDVTYSPTQRQACINSVVALKRSQLDTARLAAAGELGLPAFTPTQQTIGLWVREWQADETSQTYSTGDADLIRGTLLESLGVAAWANHKAWAAFKRRAATGKHDQRAYLELVRSTRALADLAAAVHGKTKSSDTGAQVDGDAAPEQPAASFLERIAGAAPEDGNDTHHPTHEGHEAVAPTGAHEANSNHA